MPVVGFLFKFEHLVFACFGMNLVDGYQLTIEEFSNELNYVTMYVENNLNSNMRFGWKGHILLHHIQPFLDHTRLLWEFIQNNVARLFTVTSKNLSAVCF